MPRYRVSQGRACKLPDIAGTLIYEGALVPQGIKPSVLKDWLENNFIYQEGGNATPPFVIPPVMDSNPGYDSEGNPIKRPRSPIILPSSLQPAPVPAELAGPVLVEEPAPVPVQEEKHKTQAEPVQQDGLWNFDPDELEGMQLADLNVMIVDKGGSAAKVAQTAEEAVEILTQDFTPST